MCLCLVAGDHVDGTLAQRFLCCQGSEVGNRLVSALPAGS